MKSGGRLFDEAGGAVWPQALVGDRDAPAGPNREAVPREVRKSESPNEAKKADRERGGRAFLFRFSRSLTYMCKY